MKIVAVRHLTTDWNEQGLLQGQRDIPVRAPDAEVQQQIRRNAERLAAMPPADRVLASPLLRTQQTARLYGYSDWGIEPLLRELDFGPYEGRPKQEMLAAVGDAWRSDPMSLTFGEPLTHLQQRIADFLAKYSAEGTVLIFGHGGWIRGLLSLCRYGTMQRMNQLDVPNNALVEIEYAGTGR